LTYRNNYDVTLKFDEVAVQSLATTTRVYGLVKFKQIAQLINQLDLQANPRNSKVGPVTASILDTLNTTPELFPLKSKGLVLAARSHAALDRGRYELEFVDKDLEGILDGGHNLLSIGLFLLDAAIEDEKAKKILKSIKTWDDFKKQFTIFSPVLKEFFETESAELDHQVTVELILPKSSSDVDLDDFESCLFEIQEARNNNAQLTQSTKTNKAGYFDDLRRYSKPEIVDQIEWKTNDSGDLKVADLVALAWIPLLALDFRPIGSNGKTIAVPSRVNTYSQKGTCVARYHEYMSSSEVSVRSGAGSELKNKLVNSAFQLVRDLPGLYDLIERKLPEAYNANAGRYGGILSVAKLNASGKPGFTKWTAQHLPVKSPAGFLAPLIFSAQALMRTKGDGTLEWEVDPFEFFDNEENLAFVVGKLRKIMIERDVDSDPQKVGKKDSVYDALLMAVENLKGRTIKQD
jgi:hypothetical protein